MTTEQKPVLTELLRTSLPDCVGLAGLGLLMRGLWLEFGQGVALGVCGALMLALAVVSAWKGAR